MNWKILGEFSNRFKIDPENIAWYANFLENPINIPEGYSIVKVSPSYYSTKEKAFDYHLYHGTNLIAIYYLKPHEVASYSEAAVKTLYAIILDNLMVTQLMFFIKIVS